MKAETFSMQRIDEYKESGQASALKARDYKDATDLIVLRGGYRSMSSNKEERTSSVRRLTPTECLRLQGFPSDWLDLGDWTDESGKVHKETDTPKYKAIGNSICLPFWQFLARRICAEYERDITMGGLFSGIGGFELVFQRSGAIPLFTCEIEPYCNAVLEKHFPEDDA